MYSEYCILHTLYCIQNNECILYICIQYTVYCIQNTVYCTQYNICILYIFNQNAAYCIQHIVYCIQYNVCIYTVYMYSVYCILYTVYFTVYCIHTVYILIQYRFIYIHNTVLYINMLGICNKQNTYIKRIIIQNQIYFLFWSMINIWIGLQHTFFFSYIIEYLIGSQVFVLYKLKAFVQSFLNKIIILLIVSQR